MNEAEARQIISQLEDEHTERKLGSNRFDREKVSRYVTAIANELGGNLIIGVDDNGQIKGTAAFANKIQALKHDIFSNQNISKRLRVQIYEFNLDGKRVLIFKIPSRPPGEAIAYKGSYQMRSGESLVAMDFDTLSRISNELAPDFSAEVIKGVTLSDLSEEAVNLARTLWFQKTDNQSIQPMSAKELLKGLDLLDDNDGITRAAVILLGKPESVQKYAPNSELIWEYRKHSSTIPFNARIEFKQAFLLYYDTLWQTIDARNEVVHIQEGFTIRDLKAFGEDVIREAVLNAAAHRDYRDQSSVFIKQSSDSISIDSPGGFMSGVTPDNIITASNARNRRIAEVFQKLGLVERSGQGADKIFQQTISEGKGLPDYHKSDNYRVLLSVGAQIQDREFINYLRRVVDETNIILSVNEYVLLERIRQGIDTTQLNEYVSRLVSLKLIERVGRGRGAKLILSKRYYSTFGKKGEYTRRRGLDKPANLELILRHLKIHKKGFARELEQALPHTSRQTINRYLRELSDGGKIRMVGNPQSTRGKKPSYWELASDPPQTINNERAKN